MSKKAMKWGICVPKEGIVEIRYKASKSGNPPPAEDFYTFSQRVQKLPGDFCRIDQETGHQAFFFCVRCSCSCSSPANLQEHLLGDKHNQKMTRKQLRKLARLANVSQESTKNVLESQEDGTIGNGGEMDAEIALEPYKDNIDEPGGESSDEDWPKMHRKEFLFLKALLCQDDLPECILVHGQHAVGKTSVLRRVLEASQHPHAFIHTAFEEAYGPGTGVYIFHFIDKIILIKTSDFQLTIDHRSDSPYTRRCAH